MKQFSLTGRTAFFFAAALFALGYLPICSTSIVYAFMLGVAGALLLYGSTRTIIAILMKTGTSANQIRSKDRSLGFSLLGKTLSFLYVVCSPLLLANHLVLTWLVGFTLGEILGIFHAIFHRDTVELKQGCGA